MTKYKKNGKKLGVLGGMGPAAAAEVLRQAGGQRASRWRQSVLWQQIRSTLWYI